MRRRGAAERLNIDGGPVSVAIHILEIKPGSEEARFVSHGWGGHGVMVVKATVATHGDLTIKGSITSGSFSELCEKVGNKVASEINGRRGE